MKTLVALLLLAAPAAAAPLRAVKGTTLEGVCAITSAGAIVCEKEYALPSVELVARDFVPAYHPIVVLADGKVVRVKRKGFSDEKITPEPIAVPFEVKSAGLVGSSKHDQLCVFGGKGELACSTFDHSDPDEKAVFTRLAGRFVDVTFADDTMWALDDRGALWCSGAGNCARLHAAATKAPKRPLLELAATYPSATDTPPDAPFWRISDGVKRVHAAGAPCVERVSDPKTLVCWGFNKGPRVYPRPKGDELASIGTLTCTRTGDSIWCSIFGNEFHEPFTVTVKGAAKLHYGGTRFCVETTSGELRCANRESPPSFQPVTWASRSTKK